jgi:hypothetical protein
MPEKSLKCIRAVRLLLSRSNWSPLIAPYRSVLIDCDSGILRASFRATNRNIWTDGSGSTVACVRPHDAALGCRELAANDLGNKQQCPSAFCYGDGQLPGGSIPGTPIPAGPMRLSLPDAVKRGLQTNLGIVTSGVSSSIVRAQRAQALSQLFPQITASIGATESLTTKGLAFAKIVRSFPPASLRRPSSTISVSTSELWG